MLPPLEVEGSHIGQNPQAFWKKLCADVKPVPQLGVNSEVLPSLQIWEGALKPLNAFSPPTHSWHLGHFSLGPCVSAYTYLFMQLP